MQQPTSKRSVDEYGYPLYLDAENDPALWVDCPDGFFPPDQHTEIPRTSRMTAVFYEQNDGKFLTAYSPNPPTPEAVAKAQFIDKTFVWEGAAANKAAKS